MFLARIFSYSDGSYSVNGSGSWSRGGVVGGAAGVRGRLGFVGGRMVCEMGKTRMVVGRRGVGG